MKLDTFFETYGDSILSMCLPPLVYQPMAKSVIQIQYVYLMERILIRDPTFKYTLVYNLLTQYDSEAVALQHQVYRHTRDRLLNAKVDSICGIRDARFLHEILPSKVLRQYPDLYNYALSMEYLEKWDETYVTESNFQRRVR